VYHFYLVIWFAWACVNPTNIEITSEWLIVVNAGRAIFSFIVAKTCYIVAIQIDRVQKTFLKILVSSTIVKILNLKSLVSPNWKWRVQVNQSLLLLLTTACLGENLYYLYIDMIWTLFNIKKWLKKLNLIFSSELVSRFKSCLYINNINSPLSKR
jgi:hypothetical protein